MTQAAEKEGERDVHQAKVVLQWKLRDGGYFPHFSAL